MLYSAKVQHDSKNLANELKRNKAVAGDDIFTQINLDIVTNYLRQFESIPLKD